MIAGTTCQPSLNRSRTTLSAKRSRSNPDRDKGWREKRLAAHYGVVCDLAEADSVDEAASRVLHRSCDCLDWAFGAFWKVDISGNQLKCIATWPSPQPALADFITETQRATFHRGKGFPGSIWKSGDYLWVPDLDRQSACARATAARQSGLRAAFGFPVRIHDEVLAVVEFFNHQIAQPDDDLLNLMTTIAGQMAQFMIRMEMEEQRRLTNDRLQAILNNTTSVIYLKDLEGKYLMVNRQFENLFRLNAPAVVGRTDFELFPEEAARRFTENDRMVLKKGDSAEFEETAPHYDGPHTYISVKFPLCDAHDRAYAVCGVSTDITARKRAERELVTANAQLTERNQEFARSESALRQALDLLQENHQELKTAQQSLVEAARLRSVGQLAAGVAHEVKNPLQTILMGIAYLSRNLREPDDTSSGVLVDMRDAVARADTIVRDLLALSASRPLALTEEDIHALMEESLRLVMFELNKAQIDVVRQLSADLPRLQMDKARIQELFINLFMNAIQAMPDGGRMTIRSRLIQSSGDPPCTPLAQGAAKATTPSTIEIEIEDTGSGIAPEKLPRIFDPFFTTKPAGKGSGLGLPICKQIVDSHGGDIDLSLAETGGVKVRLTLQA